MIATHYVSNVNMAHTVSRSYFRNIRQLGGYKGSASYSDFSCTSCNCHILELKSASEVDVIEDADDLTMTFHQRSEDTSNKGDGAVDLLIIHRARDDKFITGKCEVKEVQILQTDA